MTSEIFTTTPNSEIVTTRVLNYPQELVFKAWSDPEHLKNWWGTNGFTNTFHEFDFCEVGKWSFIMHRLEEIMPTNVNSSK